jgi:predicted Fe-S protein YdhL (DUF1289 family)
MDPSTEHPPSPCTNLCVIDPATGWCDGCGRTLDEIARWSEMTASQKWAVLREIGERVQPPRGD